MASTSYPELLRMAQPQIISDNRSHQRTLKTVDALMKKPRLTVAERKLLDLLAKLIDDYEESIYPTPEVSPVEMLRHLLEAKGMSQSEFAREVGIARSTINEVLNGNRSISVKSAFRLADYFHVEPSLFLSRQS